MSRDRRAGLVPLPGSAKPATRKLSLAISLIGFLLGLLSLVVAVATISSLNAGRSDPVGTAFLAYGSCLFGLPTIGTALFMALRLPVSASRWLAGLGGLLLIVALIVLFNADIARAGNHMSSAWITLVGAVMILGSSFWTSWYLLRHKAKSAGDGGA